MVTWKLGRGQKMLTLFMDEPNSKVRRWIWFANDGKISRIIISIKQKAWNWWTLWLFLKDLLFDYKNWNSYKWKGQVFLITSSTYLERPYNKVFLCIWSIFQNASATKGISPFYAYLHTNYFFDSLDCPICIQKV